MEVMSITNDQLVELIENAEDIDCALDAILFPNGRDARNHPVPYLNVETGVFMWVSQAAYLAMRSLDLAEQDTACGLTRLLKMYGAPKSKRKAIADRLVADVTD
jgi:hypothetical protein